MDGLSFDEAKARLDEIADAVEDPAISLDDALALYEEAVKIGLHACEVSEQDVLAADEEPQADADRTQMLLMRLRKRLLGWRLQRRPRSRRPPFQMRPFQVNDHGTARRSHTGLHLIPT